MEMLVLLSTFPAGRAKLGKRQSKMFSGGATSRMGGHCSPRGRSQDYRANL